MLKRFWAELVQLGQGLTTNVRSKLNVLTATFLWLAIAIVVAKPSVFFGFSLTSLAQEFVTFRFDDVTHRGDPSEAMTLGLLLAGDIWIAVTWLQEEAASGAMSTKRRRFFGWGAGIVFVFGAFFLPFTLGEAANTVLAGLIVASSLLIVRGMFYGTPATFDRLNNRLAAPHVLPTQAPGTPPGSA